ncbi:hydrolase [Shewanella litorisediminis]|uniref:Hydrolase n=1 Tax=Shewanella litorisediminis TaxID=1173586 RepID=A0ABX7G1T0_9GAMM|nr:hydrolase [Shewanella litorisediminis]MCL2918390.1 hydrolase [Shewanella litorisediminis]QRH01228.1 hydrolase [Shewanella litorisediminis]
MTSQFTPPWWAKSPHIQTILPVLTKRPTPVLRRERLELEDGDFLDLDWLGQPEEGKPVVMAIHGLEGSARSHYASRLLHACEARGLAAVVHHHRSCSGESNRLPRSYHSGDTQDVAHSIRHIRRRYPNSPVLAVGYSLGGNVLGKFLGEQQSDSPIARAVVVSAPLRLAACAKRLEKGFSRVYQSYLIRQLQAKLAFKVTDARLGPAMPVHAHEVAQLSTFYDFDDKVTAPLHGFSDVHDYYDRASGLPFLRSITTPTLVLHAADDPFMTDAVIPRADELSSAVEYELNRYGGHVGFIDGGSPWRPQFYLERRILDFLLAVPSPK